MSEISKRLQKLQRYYFDLHSNSERISAREVPDKNGDFVKWSDVYEIIDLANDQKLK